VHIEPSFGSRKKLVTECAAHPVKGEDLSEIEVLAGTKMVKLIRLDGSGYATTALATR